MKLITYGLGGYDPTKPNNNIIEEYETPDEPIDEVKAAALAKLEALGLTAQDIQAIVS